MATTWTPIANIVQTSIPNDLTGNSIAIAPVSGDNNPVTIKLGNGTNTLFAVDAAGKLSAAASTIVGNETVGGTLGVSGATTLAAVTSTGSTVNGNESISGTLNVSGNTGLAALTATSSQINGNEAITGTLNVSGLLTASGKVSTTTIATANGTTALPAYAFTNNTDTGAYLKTPSTTAAVLGLSVNATDAMTLTKNGVSVPGTLAVTGTATANIFGTAALGAAGTPVVYSTQAATTGIYFTTTPAMVFTANGTACASVTATAMNVAQLLNAQANLAVAGTSSFAAAVGVTGTVTATNLTLSSGGGGKLTFADGTTQTTSAAAAAGSSSTFTATSNGTTALPAYTFTNNTDTGSYLKTASTTAAVLGLSVNATDAMTLTKTGVSVPGALGITGTATAGNVTLASGGKLTFGDGTQQTTASAGAGSAPTFTATIANGGSATAPAFLSTQSTNSGIYFSSTSTLITANGAQLVAFNPTQINFAAAATVNVNGALNANGAATFSSTVTLAPNQPLAVSGNLSANFVAANQPGTVTAPAYTFGSQSANSGFYYPNAATGVACTAAGTLAWNASSSLITTSLPITATKTITSTTAAGTASFVSSQGFKTLRDAGTYYVTNGSASTSPQQMQLAYANAGTNAGKAVNKSLVSQFAGSVVGFSAYLGASLTTSVTIQMNVNGTLTNSFTIAANATTGSITFPKGQYPLPAGGYCFMQVNFGSATTGADALVAGDMTIEYGA